MESPNAIIRDYIARNMLYADKFKYSDDASFLNEGIIDSANILELVSFIEERFCIRVEDQDLVPENFDSVASLAAYVTSRVNGAKAAVR